MKDTNRSSRWLAGQEVMLAVMKRVLSEVRQNIRNLNPCKVEHFG
jgi:hypothetical protein